MTMEQLEALPQEEMNQVPVSIGFEKMGFGEDHMYFTVAQPLAELMYGDIDEESLRRMIKRCQADIGAEPTGELLYGQLSVLDERIKKYNQTQVYATAYAINGIYGEYASATGTWKMLDEQIGFPVNTVRIHCYKDRGICEELTAFVNTSDEAFYLGMMDQQYTVSSWDEEEVLAQAGGRGDSRRLALRINITTKKTPQTVTNNNEEGCETFLGENLPLLDKPRVSELVDGFGVTNAYFEKRTRNHAR